MNGDHIETPTLTPEQRDSISRVLAENRLLRYAARLWSDAIDAEDYDEARRIAEETDSWFEPGGGND